MVRYLIYASMIILTVTIIFTGCTKQPIMGNDVDTHGCIGSAGYLWCDAKQKCLRTWEEPCEISDVAVTFCNNASVIRSWVCDNYAKIETVDVGTLYYDINKTVIVCPGANPDNNELCTRLAQLDCTEVPCQ